MSAARQLLRSLMMKMRTVEVRSDLRRGNCKRSK